MADADFSFIMAVWAQTSLPGSHDQDQHTDIGSE